MKKASAWLVSTSRIWTHLAVLKVLSLEGVTQEGSFLAPPLIHSPAYSVPSRREKSCSVLLKRIASESADCLAPHPRIRSFERIGSTACRFQQARLPAGKCHHGAVWAGRCGHCRIPHGNDPVPDTLRRAHTRSAKPQVKVSAA